MGFLENSVIGVLYSIGLSILVILVATRDKVSKWLLS